MVLRAALLSLAFLSLTACTSTRPIRGTAEPLLPEQLTVDKVESDATLQRELEDRSIERYPDFTLGIIEFSDDGHVKNEIQKDQVFAMVRETAEENGAVIIVFVHGWHHSANVCDTNLACFRRVLQSVARSSDRVNKGPVIGVYLGWRGDSLNRFTWASFYDRKQTAHRIGENAGSKVLLNLHYLFDELNSNFDERRKEEKDLEAGVTMITVGHSFGGALVFSAVEDALVSEWDGQHGVGPTQGSLKQARPGLGNLVILVNPAFEAYRYEVFDSDLRSPGTYEAQCPVLLTVASRGDAAVGRAFPIGRLLWILWHPLRWPHFLAEIRGAGRHEPQLTHELTFSGKPAQGNAAKGSCTCPFPSPEEMRQMKEALAESSDIRLARDGDPCPALRSLDLSTALPNGVILKENRSNFDKSSPYLVMQTDPNLIPGHSDIYNQNFVRFLMAYLNLYLQEELPPSEEVRDREDSGPSPN